MITEQAQAAAGTPDKTLPALGTLGHLAIFGLALGMTLSAPPRLGLVIAGFGLVILGWLYPNALRRMLHWRWLLLVGILILLSGLGIGVAEPGVPDEVKGMDGLAAGVQMAARAVVMLVAVQGLSESTNISELAGLFERLGLHGLGFSVGVALNLLPSLQQSSANAWHSLWLRGGLRNQTWRGLQLYLVTVVANAIRRAEEVALAAEARAFSPDKAAGFPLRKGRFDRALLFLALLMPVSLWLIGIF